MDHSHSLAHHDTILQRAVAAFFAVVMTAASMATLATPTLAPFVA